MKASAAIMLGVLLCTLLPACWSLPSDVKTSYWKAVRDFAAVESDGRRVVGDGDRTRHTPVEVQQQPAASDTDGGSEDDDKNYAELLGLRQRLSRAKKRYDFRCVLHPISCYGK